MQTFDAKAWAQRIREHKNPLVVAGEGCERITLCGKPLVTYAVELAEALSCPIAATGNILLSVREKAGNVKAKKVWLAELFRFLQEEWEDSILEQRPDLLLLIGYRPEMVQGMAAGLERISIAHLGPGQLSTAQLTLEETSLDEWKRRLDELVAKLKRSRDRRSRR
jgi:CO dehydrogenase/acetyl-CoA synthase epsilon subunit